MKYIYKSISKPSFFYCLHIH